MYKRVVWDDLITKELCTEICNSIPIEIYEIGHGYGGTRHPHTNKELFYGLDLCTRQISAQLQGRIWGALMHIRSNIMEWFNLDELWVDFVHLAARQSLVSRYTPEAQKDEVGMPFHSDTDNGIEQNIYRTHSAILYLNDDFDGGEFVFREPDERVEPKAGKVIAFTAGRENIHGTRLVRSHIRYTLPVWFSTYPQIQQVHENYAASMTRMSGHFAQPNDHLEK